jgi:hypothetical protein
MGMGQAAVATITGSEALWWNPAGVARGPRELSLGFVSNEAPVSDLVIGFVFPIPKVITFAVSLRYVNTGLQESIDASGNQTGSFYPWNTTITASFAAPFGDRLNVGVNLKAIGYGFSCTGVCNLLPGATPLTAAIDAGAQYAVTRDSLLMLGVAVRNIGPPLQFNDAPQADLLPGRFDAGIAVMPRLAQYPGARVTMAADVVTRLNGEGGVGLRVGSELSWLDQYFARAGYVVQGPNGSGPSFGVGVARGRWRVDFAQFLAGGNGVGESKPTYLTLRYVF